MSRRRRVRALIGLAVVLLLVGAAWWASRAWVGADGAGPAPSPRYTPTPRTSVEGTVVWIADGDTLDITWRGERTRVRLLNVDAPERAHSSTPAQCLAEEARGALARLAPVGAVVRVDEFGRDRFGRLLAGVSRDGVLINAELVRQGLAAPFVVGGDVRLLDPIRDAQLAAAASGVGLHGASGCSIPGRLRAAERTLDALPKQPDRVAAARALPSARVAQASVVAVRAELDADARDALVSGLTPSELDAAVSLARRLQRDADAAIARLAKASGQG